MTLNDFSQFQLHIYFLPHPHWFYQKLFLLIDCLLLKLLAVQDEGKMAQEKGSAAEEEEAEDERKIQVTLKLDNRGIRI